MIRRSSVWLHKGAQKIPQLAAAPLDAEPGGARGAFHAGVMLSNKCKEIVLSLVEPYDDGVFYAVREVDGLGVASPVQLYLDLQAARGRGEEAANAVLEQAIKPSWQALAPITTATS